MFLRIALYIVSALSFVYSYIIYKVGSGSKFFLVWDAIGLGLIVLALLLKFRVFSLLPKWLNIAIAGVAGAVVLTMVIIMALIFTTFNSKGEPDLDYVIVLGAQLRTDGPSLVLKYRLDKAVEYLNENPKTICICSGGQGSNEPATEARGMADYLIAKGIDESRILLEEKSTNTRENIKMSATLIEDGASVGVITNDFHVYRALYLMRRFGFTGVSGIAAPSHPLYKPNNVLREIIGMIKDLVIREGYTN